MLWLVFAVLAGILGGFIPLIHRIILKEHEHLEYAAIFNLLGALCYLPLFVLGFQNPQDPSSWLFLIIASIFWSVVVWIGFKARKFTEASIWTPLSQTRVLFVLIISTLFLAEGITVTKILGVLLVFVGTTILTIEKGKLFGKIKEIGIQLTLLFSLLVSIAIVLDKFVLGFFTPATYGFFPYLIPGVVLAFSTKNSRFFSKIFKTKWKLLLLVVFIDVAVYFLTLSAISLTDVSSVVTVLQLSIIVSVLGGIIFLNEKTFVFPKIIGMILTIVGVILISGLTF